MDIDPTIAAERAKQRRWFWSLLGCYLATWLNLLWPVLRLTHAAANDLAFAASLLVLPFGLLSTAPNAWEGARRGLAVALSVALLLLSIPVSLGVSACSALSGYPRADRSFEKLHQIVTNSGVVAAYRTNGGATTSFGMVVRQECQVVPGLLVVHTLATEYPAADAIVRLDGTTVTVTFPAYGERAPERQARTYLVRLPCFAGAG